MKIIELLNKIANGEEMPKEIILDNKKFQYNKTYEQYHDKYEVNLLEHISDYNYSGLNDEVEIIEEEKEIRKFKMMYPLNGDFDSKIGGIISIYNTNFAELKKTIDEIIDAVNELRSKE